MNSNHKYIVISVFVGLLALTAGLFWPLNKTRQDIPVFGTVDSFSLMAQNGETYGSKQLVGDLWVANFIFTRCPTVCPLFTKKMADLQKLANQNNIKVELISLVSILNTILPNDFTRLVLPTAPIFPLGIF